jgi:ATP-dependent DNA ligase
MPTNYSLQRRALGLEGIVSKKRSAPYVAGPNCGWVKVKTQPWRQANRERYKMFEKE